MTSNTIVFRDRRLNGWPLFWLLTIPMLGFMAFAVSQHDLSAPEDISSLIGYSVRWAVPFIFWVTAASAMPIILPGEFSQWWRRNRRYTGLVFAVAMSFQGLFIFLISGLHANYYYGEIYYLRDELEGTSGYIFLSAMVFTSFKLGRRMLSAAQWKVLHRSGVYFLWAYPFSVYWWNLFYYPFEDATYSNGYHDYLFYVLGFLAFAARIAAWTKNKMLIRSNFPETSVPPRQRIAGQIVIALGLALAVSGHIWYPSVSDLFYAEIWPASIVSLQLWLPFWPLEPFMPLITIGIGAWLLTLGPAKTSQELVGPLKVDVRSQAW
tara:strand:- start:1999 stop:2964 length:966 start_codon:yes stop_codon:yes gene_type:complete